MKKLRLRWVKVTCFRPLGSKWMSYEWNLELSHTNLLFLLNTCPFLCMDGTMFSLCLLLGVSPLKNSSVAPFSFVPGCTSLRKATIQAWTRGFPTQSSEGKWEESMHIIVSCKGICHWLL